MKRQKKSRRKVVIIATSSIILFVIIAAGVTLGVLAYLWKEDNVVTLARTPPMGWNSWNRYHCHELADRVVRSAADGMVRWGLFDVGYTYIIIGDCWQASRDGGGRLQPDSSKFPRGMSALSDHLRRQGLRLGLHTGLGSMTCRRRPGSHLHHSSDALQFSQWGVSYLHTDDCHLYPATEITTESQQFDTALRGHRSDVIHSVRPSVPVDQARRFAQLRRLRFHMEDDWGVMLAMVDHVTRSDLWKAAGPGFWNDLGGLEVGNGGMSRLEYIAHFALWCILKAPLIMSHDVMRMDRDTRELLTNQELIAINQDAMGQSAHLAHEQLALGGQAKVTAVSRLCRSDNLNLMWRYSEPLRELRHEDSSMCLAWMPDNGVNISACAAGDVTQRWWLNTTSRQLHAEARRGWCLLTSTLDMVPAQLRECDARRRHKDWQGPNAWDMAYNDAFSMLPGGRSGTVLIANTNQRCLSVGGHPDNQVYLGNVTGDFFPTRMVALLLNRDSLPQRVAMNWTVIPELRMRSHEWFKYRDLRLRTDVGVYRGYYETRLEPRSAQILLISGLIQPPT